MTTVSVEICGLPGAGKSVLAPDVAAQLLAAGVRTRAMTAATSPDLGPITRATAKARLAGTHLVHTPRLTPLIAAAVARDPQRRLTDRGRKLINWLASQEQLRRSVGTGDVWLFDEGPIQALWSIGLWGDHRPLLDRLDGAAQRLRLTDQLVFLRCRPEAAAARLEHRRDPHSRIERICDPAERSRHLRRGAALLEELVDEWERRTNQTAVVIEAPTPAPAALGRARSASIQVRDIVIARQQGLAEPRPGANR